MKVVRVEQNTQEWLDLRKGRITGSKLKDIVVKRGSGRKIGFYQLIADRLALDANGENAMQRGHDLENEAIEAFEHSTDLKVDKDPGMWLSDENENIAISPDGAEQSETPTWAVEVKCLASARHVEAVLTDELPGDYKEQVLQYFVVNENLQTLFFVMYDPRVIAVPLYIFELSRPDMEEDIVFYRDYQLDILKQVDEAVTSLAF